MSQSAPTGMAEVASPALEKRIEVSIAKSHPGLLAKFLSSGGLVASQEPSSKSLTTDAPNQRRKPQGPPQGVNVSMQQKMMLSSLRSF